MTHAMIRIFPKQAQDDYAWQRRTIVDALAKAGYDCSESDAHVLWRRYSDSMCAGWMNLPADDFEIVECVRPYFDTE